MAEIRAGTAWVLARASHVRIDDEGLAALARELESASEEPLWEDPARQFGGDPRVTLAYVVTLDAINFGSGWFPVMKKRPGCSGYFTVARSLEDHFARQGPWNARALRGLRAEDCVEVFGQDPSAQPEIGELMGLFARALNDLGELLELRYEGSFEKLVEAARGSAEALLGLLAEMPLYRDVSTYRGRPIPFFKRAQLTAADLAQAFAGQGHGAFNDLDQLTLFADNLVPHVLRREGVLIYDSALAGQIDAGELLAHGCEAEVEIRAAGVQVVERLVEAMRASRPIGASGPEISAQVLDYLLWSRGQSPSIKAYPRHRSRTTAY